MRRIALADDLELTQNLFANRRLSVDEDKLLLLVTHLS